MALGDPYATLVQLRGWMGLDDTADDARLTSALAAISRGIEDVTGRQFNDAGSPVSARVFEPDSRGSADVHDFSTTTGLVVATDADGDGVFETTWTPADYELRPLNGIVGGQVGWPFTQIRAVGTAKRFPCRSRRASLQVTARWGWAAVPSPVFEACLIVASETVKLRDAPFGVAGYGDYGAIRVRKNPIAMGMLAPYCLLLIA